ncbi:MAG: polysaccharide biosynthesis tyrosine autokinase [Bacteroidota bacterium]
MKQNTQQQGHHRPHGPERSVQDYIGILIRGKWIVVGSFATILVLSFVYTKLVTPVYKASATVLIDQRLPPVPVSLDAPSRAILQNVKNEMEVLLSRSVADSVAVRLMERRYVDTLDYEIIPVLYSAYEPEGKRELASLGEVSGNLMGMVDFDPLRETDVIRITASSENPREAALVANTYAQVYHDRNIYTSRARSRALREFLENQVRDKRKGLDESEGAMQDYMENQGIVSLDDESRKVIEQLSALEANRDAVDIELISRARKLASYREQFPQQEADVARVMGGANDQYIRGLQEEIARLEVQRDVTIAQNPQASGQEIYNDRLKEIDTQIAALKVNLQARTDEFIERLPASRAADTRSDPAGYLRQLKQDIAETEIEMQSLRAKKQALNDVIRGYNAQFERIPKKSIQFARLQRAKLSNEKLYLLVESKYSEAAISERSEFGYVTVMDPAYVPTAPASPKMILNLLLGAFLGLGLGIGVVFVRELLDVRIQTPEDFKKKGYQMLAAVMEMEEELKEISPDDERNRFAREIDPHLLTLLLPFSPIAESYRLLRTAVSFPREGNPPRILVVTSPNPSEGKSTTVANLAVTFAQSGKKTLLVDCDLRKPNIHNLFRIQTKPGLNELLFRTGAHELAVQAGVIKNLDVICAGSISPNPSEVLGSQELRSLLDQARREYDMILLDASPVLAATDATVLSTIVDGAVIVTSAGITRMADIERAVEHIEGVGGKVAGYVLNRLDLRRAYGIPYGRKGYGYYGYSYHSGNGRAGAKRHSRAGTHER